MKSLAASVLVLLLVPGILCGEDTASTDAAAEETMKVFRTQYLVTLSEYRLDKPIAPTASEADILEFIDGENAKPVETVRITAVEETDSMVQFGKRATITVGMTSSGRGLPTRRTQAIEVGTILKVTVTSHPKGALAEIRYSTSRLPDSSSDEATPPDVTTNTVEATQIYELGKPRLLSMSSLEEAPCLVVSIREMK
ncbi:MAG: hypothetical protein AAFU85_14075 [Planctomycetota bacterium]